MNIEFSEGSYFEQYDEDKIQNLIAQGWEIDADGLDEDEAREMSQYINQEHRIFRKEDGLCTILVKQKSAIEEMSQDEFGQNPQDLRAEMNRKYYDSLPEVMEDNTQQK